jgi:hypothetical protein
MLLRTGWLHGRYLFHLLSLDFQSSTGKVHRKAGLDLGIISQPIEISLSSTVMGKW